MRRDDLLILDILKAGRAIAHFLNGVDEAVFLADDSDMVQSAVLQKLTVIGEAGSRLSDDYKQTMPDVPWRQIIAFRNVAVHAYRSIDWQIVWLADVQEVPELIAILPNVEDIWNSDSGGAAA